MTTQAVQFQPKLVTTLRSGYGRRELLADLGAGVSVGLVALPLAIAFAIASGVPPERGLITAIVAGFLISALGGSRVQIGGPTGAFVPLVYAVVQQHGPDALTVCTLMAGVILIVMGAARLGSIIRFIPYPLTVGFTTGIAVIIFSQQIKDLFGLTTPPLPGDFVGKWSVYLSHFGTLNRDAALLSAGSLALLVVWPRVSRLVPGPVVAVIAATAASELLGLKVETIASRFGGIPSSVPAPAWPALPLARWRELVGPSLTIAMLGAIESLLSATVADAMIEGRHRSNAELIGQGVANVASALFGGIPATGAIARTATNVRNGGRTPVAGMVHAVTLLVIVLVGARLAARIPLSALAAVLVIVAYHMSEWHAFRSLLRGPRSDIAVLVTTFVLTVFVDLTVGVSVGLVLALAFFVRRMTEVSSVREIRSAMIQADEAQVRSEPGATAHLQVPKGVAVYEAEGALFFGFAAALRETVGLGASSPKVIVLRMRHVLALDASGIRALEDLRGACAKSGARLLLSGLREQPLRALRSASAISGFADADLPPDIESALDLAARLAAPKTP